MTLHQQHPELVPAVIAPGAYAATLLRNPKANLSLKVPPKVEKAEKRKAVMYAGITPSAPVTVSGGKVKNALTAVHGKLAAWADGRPEPGPANDAVQAVGRLLDEVPAALSRMEVDNIENRLQSIERRLLDAVEQAYPKAAAEAANEAAEAAEKRLSFLEEESRRAFVRSEARRRMRENLGLPRLSLYREEA